MRVVGIGRGLRHQVVFNRQGGGLRAIARTELLQAGAYVVPGCRVADDQPFGYLLIAQPCNDQRQHLALALA